MQEAVERYFEGKNLPVPTPSTPETWAEDERFEGGYWLLVDIDTTQITTHTIPLTVRLPEALVAQIDAYARAKQISRSTFLSAAAEKALSEKT